MRRSLVVPLLSLLAACNEKPSPEASSSAAPATASAIASAPSTATVPALAKPEKLDVAALKAAFKCGKASGPCEVLEDFKDCAPMNPVTQSGDGRWMGIGYRVKDGAFVEEVTLLRSKAVPSSRVAAGALPALIAVDGLPDDRAGERTNAEKAIHAFERGDVPLPTNTAIRYVKERTEWSDAPVMSAEDNQLYVATGSGAYLCARTKQRVLLVRRSPSRSHAGDGVYAILWPVSW